MIASEDCRCRCWYSSRSVVGSRRVGNMIALLYNLANNNISYPHAENNGKAHLHQTNNEAHETEWTTFSNDVWHFAMLQNERCSLSLSLTLTHCFLFRLNE